MYRVSIGPGRGRGAASCLSEEERVHKASKATARIQSAARQAGQRAAALHTAPVASSSAGANDPMTLHQIHRMCSCVVGTDRNEWAAETSQYTVRMVQMPGLELAAKSDLLIGWPPRPLVVTGVS